MAKILLNVSVKGNQKSKPKPKYPETASNPLVEDKWMRSKQHKRKVEHLGTSKLQERCKDILEKRRDENETKLKTSNLNISMKELVDETSDTLFQCDIGENVTEFDKSDELHRTPKEETIEINDYDEHQQPNEENMLDNEGSPEGLAAGKKVPKKKLSKFYNGLIKDENYYMASKSSTITVGIYRSNDVLSLSEFQLTAKEYGTLRDCIWIDGVIIDCFAASHIHEWEDFSYISTEDMIFIVGDRSAKRMSRNRRICRVKDILKDNLIMPYLFEGHWRLLIANIKEKKLTLMDSYYGTSDLHRAAEAFRAFTSNCEKGSSLGELRNINWAEENCELEQRPHQESHDGYSCGVYVMYYMACLGNKRPFDLNFSPSKYRSEVAHQLLLKSENMEDMCSNCFKLGDASSVRCGACGRQCHEHCIYKSNVNTDDEEEELRQRTKRRKKWSEKRPDKFLCKLCRIYFQNIP